MGIILGPHEPSLDINEFLEPMVADLLKLWKGVETETGEGKQCLYAALICNSSDVPVCRKVGGFVGHGAVKGCSRCLKPSHLETSLTAVDLTEHHGLKGLWINIAYKEWHGNMQGQLQIEIKSNRSLEFDLLNSFGYLVLIQYNLVL